MISRVLGRFVGCLSVLVDRLDAWVVRSVLERERKRLIALHREAGVCASCSDSGYICTLDEPHLWHQAVMEDGRVICEWLDKLDAP